MLRVLVLVAVATLALADSTIPFEYVVRFKAGLAAEQIDRHKAGVLENGGMLMFEYNFGDFQGYSVRVPAGSTLTDARNAYLFAPEVLYFEQNQIFTTNKVVPASMQMHHRQHVNATNANADCNLQEGATWGLVRVNQIALNLDGEQAIGAQHRARA